jgi:hypothetical protein
MIWKKIVPNPSKLLSGDEMDVLMTSREKTQIAQTMS